MAKIEHYYTQFENHGIYHIYNRSVDRKLMFKSDENYRFFIRQFDKYLSDYLRIYAYCLLGNHFHFMVKINDLTHLTKEPDTIGLPVSTDLTTFEKPLSQNDSDWLVSGDLITFEKLSNLNNLNEVPNLIKNSKTTHSIVSHQFKKFFQSYAMAFNKQHNRIGTLFQTPFKRVKVSDENYLRALVCYINTNAQKHQLVDDFKDWKWSSYHNLISNRESKLLKSELIDYFQDAGNLIFHHHEFAKKINNFEQDSFIEDT
jgi:REP element-mobilizing transposase RayT